MDGVQVKLLIGMFITLCNIIFIFCEDGKEDFCKRIFTKLVIIIFGVFAFVLPTEAVLMQTFAILFLTTQLYKFIDSMGIKEIEPIKTFMTSIFK